ncbi:MAG: phosphate ABC transporter ATP-binding protein [Bacteroidales bacterium]|nr:phosphate ABC transporter ATP-binding protein [Bacteroidales bacterium]
MQSTNSLQIENKDENIIADSALDSYVVNPHIRVANLNLKIGDNHILKDINLNIPPKKITCIIGPSGCGKTTLLRSFNRMHDDSPNVKITGKIFVDDENIYDENIQVIAIRKKMGLLAQRPCPLPMSIYDNVIYGPKLHGAWQRRKLYENTKHYLTEVGLWEEVKDRLKTPANQLSIGQQQRLCLARGLAVEPEIILGDEATSALDPISTKKIEELFVTLKKDYTIILVTHTLRQAKRIADYIAFMYLGKLIEFGTTEQIFNHPQKQLTKDYISGYFS